MICKCPRAAALPDIPVADCPETFGQIQKVAFQRLTKADGSKNGFTGVLGAAGAPDLLASWTALLAAADATKVVVSPYIQAPTAEAGAPRTFGGGNETLGGIEEVIGREATPFTGVIRKVPQAIIKALKELQCEAIGVYLFDENGAVGAIKAGTDVAPIWQPIPIRAFFVGDKTLGGLEAPDSNAIQWSFIPNWSDDLAIVAPTDFNPLTDLVAPVTP